MIGKPILLLAPRVTDDSVTMWRAAIAQGWEAIRLPSWRVSEEIKTAVHAIAIYAEPLFAEAVADQLNLSLLEPPPAWLPSVSSNYLHRKIRLLNLSEVRDFPIFVKPAEGKSFEPKIYRAAGDLPEVERIGDLQVLTSTPVDFTLEVRCFVLDGKVVTASPYWRNGELALAPDGTWPFLVNEEKESLAFADRFLSDPDADYPPAFVLDVGLLATNDWAIIEANPCWGAGLYGCDPQAVLEVGRRAVIQKDQLSTEDKCWISSRTN